MIRTVLLATILIIMAIPLTANARNSHGRSSSSFYIGFSGSNGAIVTPNRTITTPLTTTRKQSFNTEEDIMAIVPLIKFIVHQ